MDSCTQSKNISPTGVKQEKKQRKIKTLHKKNITSPFIKDDDYDCCDSFTSGYCRCNDIEKEAGFIIDYYTDRIESTGKYVCKLCYKIPVKCDCQ